MSTASATLTPFTAQERLRRGIWPRTLGLWLAIFWMVLMIIRPWEGMFPEVEPLRLERMCALGAIFSVLAAGHLRFCPSLQTAGVIAFVMAAAVSSVFAGEPLMAWDEFYKCLTLMVFYFILLSAIRTPYQLLFMVTCYAATMGVYLGKAQWEYFVHGAHRYRMGVPRLCGIEMSYGHPNSVAASAVLALPMVYFLWRYRQPFTQTWPRLWRRLFPPALVACFWLIMTSVILTNSRSGMLGFAVFVFLAAGHGRSMGKKVLGIVLVGVFLAGVWASMPEDSRNRMRTIWDPSAGPENAQVSAHGRIAGLLAGLEMFQESPLTGVGMGNYVRHRILHVDGAAVSAHNLPGQLLGEAGMLGAIAFAMIVGGVLASARNTRRIAQKHPDPRVDMLSGLADACFLSLLLLLFFGMFSHNMLRFNWMFVGALGVLCRKFADDVSRQPWTSSPR